MKLVNYHFHTEDSFDGQESLLAFCAAAVNKGVLEIAVTDHYECNHIPAIRKFDPYASYEKFLKAKEIYKGKLTLRFGIEIGQASQNEESYRKALEFKEYDFILSSLHNLKDRPEFYLFDYRKVDREYYLSQYFKELLYIARNYDYDVLSHLDYPTRYLAMQNIDFDYEKYYPQISAILTAVIERGKGIEVNTSGFLTPKRKPLPSPVILEWYKKLGGEYITVGSDAHIPERIDLFIKEGLTAIKEAGFSEITLYKKRIPRKVKI